MGMKSYASFDLWAADQTAKHRRFIKSLQALVEGSAPRLTEAVKWGNGCFIGKKQPVIYLHAEDDHLQFGFFNGAALSDPENRLQGSGRFVRHIKIRKPRDIDESYFSKLIRDAVRREAKFNSSKGEKEKEKAKEKPSGDLPASLSKPAIRALLNAKIKTLRNLASYSEKEILALHGVGPSSLPKLRAALKNARLSFRGEANSSGKAELKAKA